MFDFRKTSQLLKKARPYLASRILGYHQGPLLPPIIIVAGYRGPSRKKTYYLTAVYSYFSKVHLLRSYATEFNPRNTAASVNYIGKSELNETGNAFPSAPHSGTPLIANGAGGFNIVYPSFNFSPNPTCLGCGGLGRGSGAHGSI